MCLTRSWDAYDIEDEDGLPVQPEEGGQIFLKRLTAFRMVRNALQAENAAIVMLSDVVKALHQEAVLDLIVEMKATYDALEGCANIVSHDWDPDRYCQHPGWKGVMALWKERRINATVRVFDEEGVDVENGPFQALALKEAIQAVTDGLHNRIHPVEDE
jgi:hypothetical protein